MTEIELVRALEAALNAGDLDAIRSLTSEDFVIVPEMTGRPLDRDAWLAAQVALHPCFPDLERHAGEFRVEGDEVHATVYVTATHDHVVELPAFGVERLEPTGLRLRTVPHEDIFTVRDGLVTRISSHMPPGAGLKGLIEQIRARENG